MKHLKNIFIFLMLAVSLLSLQSLCSSCSSDEPSEYKVTVEVTASPTTPVWIQGIGELDGQGVYFQDYIKRTFVCKYGTDQIIVRCDDSKVLLTVKIWVNKKLVKDVVGNSYINITHYIP